MSSLLLVIVIVILAWGYDFWNGANDCANSIATTISTRALSFKQAVFWAALFNVLGAFITTEVAKTIGKGIVAPEVLTLKLIIFALIGAIVWVAISTHLGIPISVTHSLVGGLMGVGLASYGAGAMKVSGLIKVIKGMLGAPIISFIISSFAIIAVSWLIKWFLARFSASKINQFLRRGQIFTTLSISLTHGMNDTQNAMGIISASLVAGGFLSSFKVPIWVILGSGIFMGLGTLWGGHRVIHTVGKRLYRVQPIHGFSTELSSAVLIFLHSIGGIPLSTTQVVTAGVMGVGASERRAQVNWRKIIEIFSTWIFTIPGAALISGLLYLYSNSLFNL